MALATVFIATAGDAAEERVLLGVHQGRAYRLYLPGAPKAGLPLVVALHGCAQTPEDFALGTRLDRAARRRGVRVLYPSQSALRNPSRCWNWFVPDGEVRELLALVRETQRAHGDGGGRVIALGFSAGGYMAVNLACAAPGLVAGVGVAGGGPYRCAETSRGAVGCMRGERLDGTAAARRCAAVTSKAAPARVSLWHGDGDSVVSPANLLALVEMFVMLRDLRPVGVTDRRDGAVRSEYRAADGRAIIESWLVPGMGHAWSGGDSRGTHTYPSGPDATEAMLRFLVDE